MIKFEITGLDDLQNALQDAQQAAEDLNGEIAQLHFDPGDQESIERAIAQGKAAVDTRLGQYETNPFVSKMSEGLKQQIEDQVRQRATTESVQKQVPSDPASSSSRATAMAKGAPRVFLSHASEDKERFVIRFAERLVERGVDVWLDKWEILPGDSLVDKIFEEGLAKASAVIVVLSQYSVAKPWVREELNAGVVSRINKQTKIIPVIIDKCEIPEALQSTVWQLIEDPAGYERELDTIVHAIYEHRQKPAIGKPPRYASAHLDRISGLQSPDTLVLKTTCEIMIETGQNFLTPEALAPKVAEFEIAEQQMVESLLILGGRSYLKLRKVLDSHHAGIAHFQATDYGIGQYAQHFVPDYDQFIRDVGLEILNQGKSNNFEIVDSLGRPIFLVDHVLRVFHSRGWIKTAGTLSGHLHIISISPELGRRFS